MEKECYVGRIGESGIVFVKRIIMKTIHIVISQSLDTIHHATVSNLCKSQRVIWLPLSRVLQQACQYICEKKQWEVYHQQNATQLGNELPALKHIFFHLLIPQFDIVRTQSPSWKWLSFCRQHLSAFLFKKVLCFY